jgi:hypothetical protein
MRASNPEAMRISTFSSAFPPSPVVGNPGTTGVDPTPVATRVPLQGRADITLYPEVELQPARNDIATEVPLQGRLVVLLKPSGVVQPGNGEINGLFTVPLQGVKVVALYPNPEEQPLGKSAVCASAFLTLTDTTPNTIIVKTARKANFVFIIF